jgi:pyridoxal phosphate enzyme (YggS family)
MRQIDFRPFVAYIIRSQRRWMIAENLEIIRRRIDNACQRCGRRPADVGLVAVSKTFGVEHIERARDLGQLDFGENYAQELIAKHTLLRDKSIRWHFIGHLQSNKAKAIAEFVHLVHSIDAVSSAEALNKRAELLEKRIPILVEVHTTDEATKSGVPPGRLLSLVKDLARLRSIEVRGLMTMGPFNEDPNSARPCFQELAALRRTVEREGIDGVQMTELSMGMSHDFEVAIEEGATLVRIGTAIFGKRSSSRN